MALIKCYECEKEISDKSPACPHCGAPKEEQPPQSDPSGRKPVLPFIVLALIGFLLLLFVETNVLLTTFFVCVLGWCLKLVIRRNWFRGHHTQVVITTVLAWLFMWFANVRALDRPAVVAVSASM